PRLTTSLSGRPRRGPSPRADSRMSRDHERGAHVSDVVVGVDLGGTKTAAALVRADGAVGPVRSVPTPATAGPEAVLDAVAGLVRDVVAHGGVLTAPDGTTTELTGPVTVSGLGVGTAGVVDTTSGT